MKNSGVIVTVFILIASCVISFKPLYSADYSESLRPTQPPRIPVTDYDTGPHRIMDFMYLHYDFDVFVLDGGGLGFNYVNSHEKIAYNLGIGFFYMQGGSTGIDPLINVYSPNLPLNANIGYRLLGDPSTNSLMIFGGLQWMYTWLIVDIDDIGVYAYGPTYGPIAGAKAELKVTPSVSIIPYYIFQHTIFDITVEVEGVAQDVAIDPVTAHLFGFDIKVSGFSVGALLDVINNTDNSKITILFSYDFDYSSGSSNAEKESVQQDDKKRVKKPAKKQTDVR